MSKILCECGNVIIDQTDNLEYKAYFIRDQDIESVEERSKVISDFIKANLEGKRNEWLEGFFDSDIYNVLDDENVISDILLKFENKYISKIYQCKCCGVIKIQIGNSIEFVSFSPAEVHQMKPLFKGLS